MDNFKRLSLLSLLLCGLTLVQAHSGNLRAQNPTNVKVGILGSIAAGAKGTAGEGQLKELIQTETGLTTEVSRQDDWKQLADRLADKTLDVAVFQGFEFAWAQQRKSSIKPLAIAVNGPRYPVVYVMTAKNDAATAFEGLKGRAISIPKGPGSLRLFADRQAQTGGKTVEEYFGKVTTPDNSEDALDDVVDGIVAAAIVDRAALDTFKRRKAGRSAKLKELATTGRMVPVVIAFADGGLDEATRKRFQQGLISSSTKDRGQSVLSLFKISGFEEVPADFAEVLAESRRAFPLAKDGK